MPVDDTSPAYDWLQDQGEDASLLFYAQTAFTVVSKPTIVGLAVSGGSDSMAMLHLLARAAPHSGWTVRAVTVDHRLRPEALTEAELVSRVCESLGVPHQVLVWDHGAVAGNLMDVARKRRYGLMAEWAAAQGIGHIAVGHTADDQAETFLMGLSRAAGLDGLCGMRRNWTEGGVVFQRPFLQQSRQELRAYLTRHGVPWVNDPTNDDATYTRTKARRALKALKPLGITVDRLNTVIHHLAMTQGAVREAVDRASTDITREASGALFFDRKKLRYMQPELQRRLLIAALQWVSGSEYAPRSDAMIRLTDSIRAGRDATLWGCRIKVLETEVLITREPRAVRDGTPWDNRWHVTGPQGDIRALGTGLRQIKDWRAIGLPRAVLEVTPAIWQGDTLIAAPLAGFGPSATATVQPTFGSFLLSH